jgi:Zn-dependent peptidase ImmA (M78 family)
MAVRRKHVRSLAEGLLSKFDVKHGTAVPVDDIVKALGIDIRKEQVDDDLSGFLFRDVKHKKATIGVNAAHPENRVRFTLAHELGHYLLHEGETLHFDGKKPGFTVSLRSSYSAKGTDDNEKEANLFAAELLMPAKFLERDLRGSNADLLDENALHSLATKYKVSAQALTFRLANLGYIEL